MNDNIIVMHVFPVCHFSKPTTVEDGFIFTIETTNTSSGSSLSDQFACPFLSSGTYDCNIDWGDGSNDDITTWDQAETTHTYTSSGEYIITITGQCNGWAFGGSGDRLKILDISNWGNTGDTNGFIPTTNGGFNGCSNLDISANGAIYFGVQTNFSRMFQACSSLTNITSLNASDFSSASILSFMHHSNSSLNSDLNYNTTSALKSINNMMQSMASFNSDVNFDVSGVTNAFAFSIAWPMHNRPISFNFTSALTNLNRSFESHNNMTQTVSLGDTSSVTIFNTLFKDWNFDEDISDLDFTSCALATGMLDGVTLSPVNYDALLARIRETAGNTGWSFSGGNSTYSSNTISVTSIIRSGSTATVTTGSSHGLSTNDEVYISGADQSEYNVVAVITVTGASTFEYEVSGTPTTPATGTIICEIAQGGIDRAYLVENLSLTIIDGGPI